jgi:hypothetical protein
MSPTQIFFNIDLIERQAAMHVETPTQAPMTNGMEMYKVGICDLLLGSHLDKKLGFLLSRFMLSDIIPRVERSSLV